MLIYSLLINEFAESLHFAALQPQQMSMNHISDVVDLYHVKVNMEKIQECLKAIDMIIENYREKIGSPLVTPFT